MSWTRRRRNGEKAVGRSVGLSSVVSPFRRRALLVAAIALSAVPPFRLSAQRAPVLQQIHVPHAYYYREMYLPQATSGPSAVAWSPDGSELVYSMQGSLWRQRLGAPEAVQLTDGPGYDYQPDWSPDGTSVVYTSYRNDAMELRLLDLASGADRALVADGAVNLDPRFSPDGHRVAFVSTAFQARWHVFVVELDATGRAAAGPPVRLTADNDSRLPRYYYSVYDHYLSPAWSPDGKELILVSNRGHVWGSGGLWRMEARPDAPMREIRSEETTWKARPDWSRDGRRVVYSSYLGRQRNQLWLTTADGGDPLQLTYCECDHTAPRWSPDGARIAFVSNEAGSPSLRVVTVPGGAVETVAAKTRRYLHATGTLRIVVTDPAGTPIAARASLTGPDGRGRAPDDAWRHADDGFDRSERKFERTYFHAAGRATLTLPAGEYAVEATRGLEYARVVRKVTVAAAATGVVPIRLARLVDLPARGWWSGDLHVHMNYGGGYRHDAARLRSQAEAEDLHVLEDLVVNKEQRIPDIAVFRPGGRPDPVSTATTIIRHDQEYHTSTWGHTGHLGLIRNLILPDYAGYANTAAASLYPDNTAIFDLSHAQGGVSGYAHPFESVPDPAAGEPLTDALPGDVALGGVDYRGVGGFSDPLASARVWYRLLNAGFRLPAGAGTDAMANFASLHGPVGMNRGFVPSGPPPDPPPPPARRAQARPPLRQQRPAARVHRERPRGGGRARPARRPPPAGRAGLAPLLRAGGAPRDRGRRRRRGTDSDQPGRHAGRRDRSAAGNPERVVHPARLVIEGGPGGARHLSVRDDEPGLRHRRREADPIGRGRPLVRPMDRAAGAGGRGAHRVEHGGREEDRTGPPGGRRSRVPAG